MSYFATTKKNENHSSLWGPSVSTARNKLGSRGTHLDHLSILLLGPAGNPGSVLAVEDGFAVLVEFDGGNDNIAGVDTDGGGGAIRLVAVDTVDVDHPLLSVHLRNLALPPLELATDNQDLVILAHWQ